MKPDTAISLQDVWVQYRLRHAHHYNLKRTVTNMLVGRSEPASVITALEGVTLDVPRGARVGLVGLNGAGKSTLLAVMSGILKPTLGSAVANGRILALLGGPNEGLDPEQTGRENSISLGTKLGENPSSMEARVDEIRDFSGLGTRFDHPVYTYSSGMQVRLRFTTITSIAADILLVDEGMGAADAEFSSRANERLRGFYARAGTLVLATHSESMLTEHCTSKLVLEAGRLL